MLRGKTLITRDTATTSETRRKEGWGAEPRAMHPGSSRKRGQEAARPGYYCVTSVKLPKFSEPQGAERAQRMEDGLQGVESG